MEGAYKALMIGNNIGTFISPFSPAMWLAHCLAGATYSKHLKYSFFIIWASVSFSSSQLWQSESLPSELSEPAGADHRP